MGQIKGDVGPLALGPNLPPANSYAVWGDGLNVDGIVGTSNLFAVRGTTSASDPSVGAGVLGTSIADFGGTGVAGHSTNGKAVLGIDPGNQGIGVAGMGSTGVRGESETGIGVDGYSKLGTGVYGAGGNVGVFASGGEKGVFAWAPLAGHFLGDVKIVGQLSKSGGGFRIDHPLDPEQRYLNHSFVESPERKNLYDGTAVCDRQGEAVVALPDWFEPLNHDLRYQLTPIGAPAPGLHVAAEVEGGRFRIAGGAPGLKVSWQVTGTRRDAWAKAHPLAVEEDKDAEEREYFLHPEEHGHPVERGIHRKVHAEAQEHLNRPVTPLDPDAPRPGEQREEP